jgi:uncharacterized membrane protein YsdA (DUF1294 family)/cold shock CspA family protein
MKSGLQKGQLVRWKDDRGFGFIQPVDGSKEVFLHISELKNANRRPEVGDIIYYEVVPDKGNKVRATHVVIQNAASKISYKGNKTIYRTPSTSISKLLIFKTILLFTLPLIGTIHFAFTTTIVFPLILYVVMSLLTFGLYADDKSRAKRGAWRTSENTLHLFELAGGLFGGFIAQQTLYHKSTKSSYQEVFWVIVAIHNTIWLAWFIFSKSFLR